MMSSRWSRISAARYSFATLASVVTLTVLALLPRPSWLESAQADSTHRFPQSAKDGHTENHTPAEAVSLTKPEPFGFAEFLSAGVEGLRNLNQSEMSALSMSSATEFASSESAWTRWFVWVFAVGVLLGLMRLFGGVVSVRLMVLSSRPLRSVKLQEMMDVLSAELRCPARIELRESKRLIQKLNSNCRHYLPHVSGPQSSRLTKVLPGVLLAQVEYPKMLDPEIAAFR